MEKDIDIVDTFSVLVIDKPLLNNILSINKFYMRNFIYQEILRKHFNNNFIEKYSIKKKIIVDKY